MTAPSGGARKYREQVIHYCALMPRQLGRFDLLLCSQASRVSLTATLDQLPPVSWLWASRSFIPFPSHISQKKEAETLRFTVAKRVWEQVIPWEGGVLCSQRSSQNPR